MAKKELTIADRLRWDLVKMSWLRHRGNLQEVIQDVGLPEEVVLSEVEKIKEESKDPEVAIANNISKELLFGYQSRVSLFMAILKKLSINLDQRVSTCCSFAVVSIPESEEYGYTDYRCLKCKKRCETTVITNAELVALSKEVITELREEDKELRLFAKDMGYTNATPSTVINQRQNILMFDTMNNGKAETVMKKVEDLTPMDRDRLVERLNKEIIDLEIPMDETLDEPMVSQEKKSNDKSEDKVNGVSLC